MKSSGYINYANGDGEQQHRAKMGTGNKWALVIRESTVDQQPCEYLFSLGRHQRNNKNQKQNSENPDVLLPVFSRKGFLLNSRASFLAPSFLLRWNGGWALHHTFSFYFRGELNWKKTSNAEVWSLFSTLPGLARGAIWESTTLCSIPLSSPPPPGCSKVKPLGCSGLYLQAICLYFPTGSKLGQEAALLVDFSKAYRLIGNNAGGV